MRSFKSIRRSFADCPFSINQPDVTFVEPYIHVSLILNFFGKSQRTKYMIYECRLTGANGSVIESVDNDSNFNGHTKHTIIIKNGTSTKFTLIIGFITIKGDYIEVTYAFEKNHPVILKSVCIDKMTMHEKSIFIDALNEVVAAENTKNAAKREAIPTQEEQQFNHDFDSYINAVSNEMIYLKNNGGKKHKVTDGHLLTPNSNEFCYSFELESELYLSDDAPVTVLKGTEMINGSVIVCDGFQIIVSLVKDIGESVPFAQISVEPWKLLEKLRDKIKTITPKDKLAWKLFHAGPQLAEKTSEISNINKGQSVAIRHALNKDITVIWGPPGTGKTYTMARMTEEFVAKGKSVLIVSHSNISVDNVVKQISNQFTQLGLSNILSQGKVLRYGYVRDEELDKNFNCVAFNYALNCHPELKKQYYDLLEKSIKLKTILQFKHDPEKAAERKEVEKLLKNIRAKLKTESQTLTDKAQVVATTVSKIYMDKLFDNKKFDVVMFDEVSMAYVPQLLCAATFAKEKFICVGDFRQLSPIVQSEKAKNVLQNDIFEFLNICKHNQIHNHPWLVMLNEQRRMHPGISRFSSQHVYRGLLKDHPSVSEKWNSVLEKEPISQQPMNLIDLFGTFCAASKNADNSRFNILSALISFATAIQAEEAQEKLPYKSEEKVGIITPYAAQTRLIRAMIHDYRQNDSTYVSCATVHQFQGSERNIIIFDAVESYPFIKPGWLVSKNENGSVLRLINVALTRARCKFITLANTKFWSNKFQETSNTYYKLLEHIKSNDNVIDNKNHTLIEYMQSINFGKNIKFIIDDTEAWDLILKDIANAKKTLTITLPTDRIDAKYGDKILQLIKEKSKNCVILGKAKETEALNDEWKKFFYKSKDAAFPLIAIDNRIVWYGFPVSELFFEDKNYRFFAVKTPIFRITGNNTIEMIHSLCDLDYRIDIKGTKVKLLEKSNASAGNGLAEFIYSFEKCSKCDKPMNLFRSHNGKYLLKCSDCGGIDLLKVNTMNRYLDKVNHKCSVCGTVTFAGVGQFGIYVKCKNGHFTKLAEL